MSVNPTGGFGFRWTRNRSGGAPTCQLDTQYILSSYGTQIFRGDAVVFNAGYIQLATAGTTTIAGIFMGCEYQSTSLKQPRFSPYWPGSDSAQTAVKCQIISDPYAVFLVRSTNGSSAIAQASVDQNINFFAGTGNTSSGISAEGVDQTTIATTSTLPFRIINTGNIVAVPSSGFLQFPANDSTTANNLVEVVFNNQMLRNNTAV